MHRTDQRITGAETLVLCVHGIQGSPSQFAWLTAQLPGHVDYLCPLLPGHGASVREFAAAGSADWLDFICETSDSAAARYRNVVYVGHSMGCLLGIHAAAEGADFKHMLLLACPLSLRPTVRYGLNNWRAVTQRNPSDPWVQAAQAANSVHAGNPLSYLRCIRPYWGLLTLMHRAKALLPSLDVPVTAMHSDRDEIVGARSLDILKSRAGAKTVLLPGSGHFLYSDAAKQTILRAVTEAVGATGVMQID